MTDPGRVAVVGGTGEEGFGLASRWAMAGIETVIGSRERQRAEAAAERLRRLVPGAAVEGHENASAVENADIVVVTVPFSAQADIYKSLRDHINDQVVIDATVPVGAAVGDKATHVLGVWDGSAAQQAAAILPKGSQVAAAFHSLAAAALSDLERPLEGDVLVCGMKRARAAVEPLVAAIPHLRFVNAGPLENARIIEPITALLIGINRRYKTDRAGLRITGLEAGEGEAP